MIGKKIKQLRTENSLTQKELAEKLFVTAQAVSRWENGDVEPSISTIVELSKVFNVSINELVGVEDNNVKTIEQNKSTQKNSKKRVKVYRYSKCLSFFGKVISKIKTIKKPIIISLLSLVALTAFTFGTLFVTGVLPKEFDNITFNDLTVYYDGEMHTIVATGVPEKATVTYTNNGPFVEMGTYEIGVKIKAPWYSTYEKTATLFIDKSKETYDLEYIAQINNVLSNESFANEAPKDYVDLMMLLSENGFCDTSNPFMLASILKQENAYLVWYPGANNITLVNTEKDNKSIQFVSNVGLGNGVLVFDENADYSGTQAGYLLCYTGNANAEYVANIYYDYYVTYYGNYNYFISNSTYVTNGEIDTSTMYNQAWANVVKQAISNQKGAYFYDATLANQIKNELSTQETITYDVEVANNKRYNELSADEQKAVNDKILTFLATVASMSNDSTQKSIFAGKSIVIQAPMGTIVDMSSVSYIPIGNTYRTDTATVQTASAKSTANWDFGNITLKNVTIPENTFVVTGAEYQPESDNSYSGGAYAFTYGILGNVVAATGSTVTIKNLYIEGINVNLNGAFQDVDGVKTNVVADMAGIICGYTQGNVKFINININGISNTMTGATRGNFSGFDSVAGLVGRSYGAVTKGTNTREVSLVTINNCSVKNLNINGVRRASGLVGFTSSCNLAITKTTIENVAVNCIRTDGKAQLFGGIIADFGTTKGSIEVDGLTIKDCSTNFGVNNGTAYSIFDAEYQAMAGAIGPDQYMYFTCLNNLLLIRVANAKASATQGVEYSMEKVNIIYNNEKYFYSDYVGLINATVTRDRSEIVLLEKQKELEDLAYVAQMDKVLNDAISANEKIEDYVGLMMLLSEHGFCDSSNPFILASLLIQENAYLVWYPGAKNITLVNTKKDNKSIQFVSNIGLGNGVLVFDEGADYSGTQTGYLLCFKSNANTEYIAKLYYDYYIVCGGDINKFTELQNERLEEIDTSKITNKAWASAIEQAIKNANKNPQ